jgi:DNA-binding NarL/FixJ family response regulator
VRVLIVEDYPVFADALRGYLESKPWCDVVGVAENGAKALTLALMHDPEVLLVDAHLPLASGFTVTSFVREHLPNAFIIMMCGDDAPDIVAAARVAGAHVFMRKDELVAHLADTISRAATLTRHHVAALRDTP